jgi:hypothetical protein
MPLQAMSQLLGEPASWSFLWQAAVRLTAACQVTGDATSGHVSLPALVLRHGN